MSIVRSDKKIPAGLLAIFLGYFGVHKFFLGYRRAGLTMLVLYGIGVLLSFVFGIGGILLGGLHLVSFIEGIIYLTRSDTDFYFQYVRGRREWF